MRQEVIALENNTKFSLILWFLSRFSYEDCVKLFSIVECTFSQNPPGYIDQP